MDQLIQVINEVLYPQGQTFIVDDIFYKRLAFHKLLPFVYKSINKEKTSEEIYKKIKNAYFLAIQKDTLQLKEMQELSDIFEKEHIKACFLKGCVTKTFYPQTFLRYMGDLDILVKEEDLLKVDDLLKERGYKKEKSLDVHIGYSKPPYLELEIHRKLMPLYDSLPLDLVQHPFEHLLLTENKEYILKMNDEDFFIFMLAHLSKHLDESGTGIRSFLDVKLYLDHHPQLDLQKVEKAFENCQLVYPVSFLINFSLDLFKDQMNEEEKKFFEVVILSGVYGSNTVRVQNGIEKNKNSRVRYFFSRLFPPKVRMQANFPILIKRPYLIGFFYIYRLFKGLITHPIKFFAHAKDISFKKKRKK